jgi:hypothetical protein
VLFSLALSVSLSAQTEWVKYPGNPVIDEMWHWSVIYDGSTYHMWGGGIDYATSPDGIHWDKYAGNPVMEDAAWPTVIYNGTTYKMWYIAPTGSYGYATSPDGVNWTEYANNPVMEPGPPGSWDAGTNEGPSVIFDGQIYHMWYHAVADDNSSQIGYATSPDGIAWTKHPSNPVLDIGSGYESKAVNIPSVLYDGSMFQMWYNGWDGGAINAVGYATSTNGYNWKKHPANPALEPDPGYFGAPEVIFDGEVYHMWFGSFAMTGYARTPLQHDLVIVSLPATENGPIWANISPLVNVWNVSSSDESNVAVTCEIDSAGIVIYSDTQTISQLKSAEETEVEFRELATFDEYVYNVTFYNQLASDQLTSNDTLQTTLTTSTLLDNFESGITKWITTGDWGLDFYNPVGGLFNLSNSPPNTSYENDSDTYAEYRYSFNLSTLESPKLSFQSFHFLGSGDVGYVEVSSDRGQTWQQLRSYEGFDTSWNEEFIELNSYVGEGFNDVRLRFRVVTNEAQISLGWFIDDIEIDPGEIVSVTTAEAVPSGYALYPNYPNPFNPKTIISYQLPVHTDVELSIFSVTGQKIVTLVSQQQPAGNYKYEWDASDLASGVYFYRITAGEFVQMRKLLLLK